MTLPHLRDLPVPALPLAFEAAGVRAAPIIARDVALAMHQRRALSWEELPLGREARGKLEARFRFGPLLHAPAVKVAADGTRKYVFPALDGEAVEVVLIRNLKAVTLCLSSQAGCALGCTFCATAALGLRRNLSPGEILESLARAELDAGLRVSDVIFMGQGEPLQNYDAVMDACTSLNHHHGPSLSRKRISISTAGLTPRIRRYAAERRPWRLYLSLHSAVEETRERLMPVTRAHPLPGLLDAMREYQTACAVPWVTLQYVAIPGVNMDDRHVEALRERLQGLRAILDVIPWNDIGGPYRSPTWAEVRDFRDRLMGLGCPVKTRYSAGKQDGMGCGQLTAGLLALAPKGGHIDAPWGIYTD
ncbi:MAG: 23S rRNA (adenine(2503)-C(2))-methyltransferase RlmN [Planctomycetes bacterium]|nr:23S rRNA (adenine(2503)-C(2))-methyltransferase RlmN [Planctomycetota bacterium]